jgi:cellulose synthase/poly-beta-1,6-N-acetylglucosamine synthase-like glycosyltransferase
LKGKKGEPPFVSVIVPAKSEVVYTKECLDSLPNQDYRPNKYEIVARAKNQASGWKNAIHHI